MPICSYYTKIIVSNFLSLVKKENLTMELTFFYHVIRLVYFLCHSKCSHWEAFSQSSTYAGWMKARLANDGNKRRLINNPGSNSCSHTAGTKQRPQRAWWQVDLLDRLQIARIAIVPRKLGKCLIISFEPID